MRHQDSPHSCVIRPLTSRYLDVQRLAHRCLSDSKDSVDVMIEMYAMLGIIRHTVAAIGDLEKAQYMYGIKREVERPRGFQIGKKKASI